MSPPSQNVTEFPVDAQGVAPATMSETRPMLWSIRRELWENRFLYIAPLIVTAVVLFSSLIGTTINLPKRMRSLPTLDPAKQEAVLVKPFLMAPAPIMLATLIIGVFYSLDALYGERRDRSILFWKSLPVSDRTTVLSKASIPIVVLPLIALVLSIATQLIMLWVSTGLLLANGMSPARLWAAFEFFPGLVVMFYGLAAHALWFAPIYGWLLLVSAWARRMPVLWAVLPLLAISAVERITFGSMHFMSMLQYRVAGAMIEGFGSNASNVGESLHGVSEPSLVRFLTAPGLWIGLVFAAACLAAAVRLRRYRQPI
jgi:ABC-2 type transport system permease protein